VKVRFADVQSHVLLGFKNKRQSLLFFRITDVAKFKHKLGWFEALITWTDAELKRRETDDFHGSIGMLAFAFRGLSRLLPDADLAWLRQPRTAAVTTYGSSGAAFAEDCYARANAVLLDTREELAGWVVGAPSNAPDGVLLLTDPTSTRGGSGETRLDEVTRELADCADLFHPEHGYRLLDRDGHTREHFGFRDGVSPQFVEVTDSDGSSLKPNAVTDGRQQFPGETLLFSKDAGSSEPPAKRMPEWLYASSFLVFRRLKQDVAGFHDTIAAAAKRTGRPVANIAMRVLGRSVQGGSPMAPPIEIPNDHFDYSSDPNGTECPFSAHARRANPRSAEPKLSHPVFRRSLVYGEASPSTFDSPKSDGIDRGLLFLCYQASIEGQFEYVTRHWLNNHDSFASPIDALLGKQAGKTGDRDIDLGIGQPVTLGTFVRATGAGYFLTPTRTALRRILEV
jgi:Dyp-type peroxidase family